MCKHVINFFFYTSLAPWDFDQLWETVEVLGNHKVVARD